MIASGDLPVPPRPSSEAAPSHSIDLPVLRSADLLNGRQEILIEHGGQIYRLRVTRSGKLLLQK